MTELAELEKCVKRLTKEVVDIRGVATRASMEAADVHTRLKGHTRTLEALRETQVEQGLRIDKGFAEMRAEMRAGFASVNERFVAVDERFASMDKRFVSMDERFANLEERFGQLEGEVKQGFATVGVELAQIGTMLRIAIGRPGQPVES